jgi:DnaK suppressor protein
MSPGLIVRLRSKLLAELKDRIKQADDRRTTVGELTGQTDADSILERELADASYVLILEAIADIRAALERMEAGRYGSCERCGQPISIKRLEAIPHARLCVRCPEQASPLLG